MSILDAKAPATATGPRRVRVNVEDARLEAIRRAREYAARNAEEAAARAAHAREEQERETGQIHNTVDGYYNSNTGEYHQAYGGGGGGGRGSNNRSKRKASRNTKHARKHRRHTRRHNRRA